MSRRRSVSITTNSLNSTLVYLNEKSTKVVGDLFKPAAGTEFVNIEVVGEECPLTGKYPVTREVVGKFLTEGEKEVEEGELEFPATAVTKYYANAETATSTAVNTLQIKAKEAKFTGKFTFMLTPKAKVGVFPG